MFSVSPFIPNGSIEIVDASNPADVRLRMRVDEGDNPFIYYCHFRAAGVRGVDCRYSLLNGGDVLKFRLASHANLEGRWVNTGVMASYDRRDWFRIPLSEKDGIVTWQHCPGLRSDLLRDVAALFVGETPRSHGRTPVVAARAP